jgi:hypothetical protein
VSWRKPVTFGLAFGLALATLSWVSAVMAWARPAPGCLRRRRVAEVRVITVQAWRGVPSHFNTGTSPDATFAPPAAAVGR